MRGDKMDLSEAASPQHLDKAEMFFHPVILSAASRWVFHGEMIQSERTHG